MEAAAKNYKKDLAKVAAGLLAIFLFIISTNPSDIPAFMLLVFPVLVAATGHAAVRVAMAYFTQAKDRVTGMVSAVMAFGLLLIVSLGSLGQLGIQDVLLALLLVGGLVFYIKRVYVARHI